MSVVVGVSAKDGLAFVQAATATVARKTKKMVSIPCVVGVCSSGGGLVWPRRADWQGRMFFHSTSSANLPWKVTSEGNEGSMDERSAPTLIPSSSRMTMPSLFDNKQEQASMSRLLPRNILLLRHGRSLGNDDETLFSTMPDWKIPLSAQGCRQARAAGRTIREIVNKNNFDNENENNERLLIYVSPYVRTKQTLDCVRKEWEDHALALRKSKNKSPSSNSTIIMPSPSSSNSYFPTSSSSSLKDDKNDLNNRILFIREEPRLREQDFGNFQDPDAMKKAKQERPKFGRFFYRFPHGGESGADVFDRVSAFCGTFQQDLEQVQQWQRQQQQKTQTSAAERNLDNENDSAAAAASMETTALFVTHGITARLFLMKWLHWTVEDFEALYNPPNCGLLHLRRQGDGYRLSDASRTLLNSPPERGIGKGLQQVLMKEEPWWRNPNDPRRYLPARDEKERYNKDAWKGLPETAWGM